MFTIWVNLTSFEFLRNIFQKRIQLPISEDIRPMSRPRSQWKAPDSGNLLSPDSGDLFPFYTNCLPVLFHPKYLDFLKYFIFNLDLNIWNVLYVSSQSRAQSMLLPAAIQSSKLKGSFVASCIHCAFHLERNQDWRSERYMQALKCFFFRESYGDLKKNLSEREMFFNSPWNVLEMFLIRESFAASLKSSCGAPLAIAVHCGSMASFPGTDTKCIQAILVVGGNWSRAPQSNPIKVYFLLFSGRKEWVARVPRIYWPRQCNQAPSGIELLFTFCKTV